MNSTILFISDSSINNPILYSQGLPFLDKISRADWKCLIISFETIGGNKSNLVIEEELEKYKSNKKLEFIQIEISASNYLPNWIKMFLKGTITSYKLFNQYGIGIVHARSFLPSFIAVTLKIFLRKKIKIVYDTRGAFIDEWLYLKNLEKNSVFAILARKIERIILKYSDKIVVVSKFHKKFILNHFGKSFIDESKIIYIPNRTFIDPDYRDMDISKNKVTDREKSIAIYSGSLAPWQGFDELIEIIHICHSQNLQLGFKLVNYEPEKLYKKYDFKKDKYLKNIEIVKLEPSIARRYLNVADLGILLRVNHFISRASSPLKFAEYLAAGLPVLAGEGIGDSEEIIKKYNVGVIIKNKNYLEALNSMMILLKDKEIKKRCRSVAEKYFNIEQSFSQYEQIYNSLLQESSK